MAASPTSPRRDISTRRRVQHVIIPEPLNKDRICLGHRGVWWAEIETKGRIAHGSMPFLGDCAVRHMGAVLAEMEASLFPLLARQAHRDARGPRRRAILDAQHQRDPRRGAGAGRRLHRPAGALRAGPLSHHHRPPLPDRRGHRRGKGRDLPRLWKRSARAAPARTYEIPILFEVMPTMTDPDGARGPHGSGRHSNGCSTRMRNSFVSPGTLRPEAYRPYRGRLEELESSYGPAFLDLAHQPERMGGNRRHGGQRQGHGADAERATGQALGRSPKACRRSPDDGARGAASSLAEGSPPMRSLLSLRISGLRLRALACSRMKDATLSVGHGKDVLRLDTIHALSPTRFFSKCPDNDRGSDARAADIDTIQSAKDNRAIRAWREGSHGRSRDNLPNPYAS